MLEKVVHVFFIITGGTIGFLYGPDIVHFFNLDYIKWSTSPYLSLIVFAIIFFIISYFIVGYNIGRAHV